jgi:hypothetical protein
MTGDYRVNKNRSIHQNCDNKCLRPGADGDARCTGLLTKSWARRAPWNSAFWRVGKIYHGTMVRSAYKQKKEQGGRWGGPEWFGKGLVVWCGQGAGLGEQPTQWVSVKSSTGPCVMAWNFFSLSVSTVSREPGKRQGIITRAFGRLCQLSYPSSSCLKYFTQSPESMALGFPKLAKFYSPDRTVVQRVTSSWVSLPGLSFKAVWGALQGGWYSLMVNAITGWPWWHWEDMVIMTTTAGCFWFCFSEQPRQQPWPWLETDPSAGSSEEFRWAEWMATSA